MKFRTWLEGEAGMGMGYPMGAPESNPMMNPMVNRGSETPASDEVKRTGLQPQVDSEEIETKEKKEQDKILAIDAKIQRFEKDLPPAGKSGSSKMNQFKDLWQQFKEKWEKLKIEEVPNPEDDGLGTSDDEDYVKMMQQHPNMVVTGPHQMGNGPGTFGVS